MRMGSGAYQCDSEGVLRKSGGSNSPEISALCQQSQHNHTIGNQAFNVFVWNKVTPIWLALTFVRFQFRSILT